MGWRGLGQKTGKLMIWWRWYSIKEKDMTGHKGQNMTGIRISVFILVIWFLSFDNDALLYFDNNFSRWLLVAAGYVSLVNGAELEWDVMWKWNGVY